MTNGALRAPLLVTARGSVPKRGSDLGAPTRIEDAVVAWRDGSISYVGPAAGYDGEEPRPIEGSIVPGFVDCHTHLPFFGWRADEFEARRAGRSYRDLHGEGGIYRSARLLADASDDEVVDFCMPLFAEALSHGTTTIELKTGYGLSVEAELRQARLARRLADLVPQTCRVTLLACHAIPRDLDRETWVEIACKELIPRAAEERLVDAVDIYVEDIAFTLEDLVSVAEAARAAGLPLRCHVEQLSDLGGALRAVSLGAASVDHLNHVGGSAVEVLAVSATVGVLLPASTFVLGSAPPPARALIDAGAAVSIASDFNPGTSPVISMPEVIAFASALYGLSATEALVAATANAASVLRLEDELGTLEVGKRADLLVMDGTPEEIPYRPGHNPVMETYVGGTASPF